MPNGHSPKEYGKHKYASHDGTSDCEHGCGCWMGPARSGGPAGLDPGGTCPNNPVDGKRLGGNSDYTYVVEGRIQDLCSRLSIAEQQLKQVEPDKIELAQQLAEAKKELDQATQLLDKFLKDLKDVLVAHQ